MLKQTAAYQAFKQRKKAIQRYLSLPLYLGSQYRCPVCRTNLNRFKRIWKSYPRMLRENGFIYPLESIETFNFTAYSCPCCDASDRERLYALYIDERFKRADRTRAHIYVCVDFAASYGLAKKMRSIPWVHYRTADLYRPGVDDRVDISNMSCYADRSIDMFICSHILEHVPDDRKAMRELWRVLKPGGYGIVMVPLVVGVDETHEDLAITDSRLRWKYFAQGDHLRLYGRRDFVERLKAANFIVHQLDREYFGLDVFRTAGIHENSVLYVVERESSDAVSWSNVGCNRPKVT